MSARSSFLSSDEVREITRREQPKAQARVLRALGIPFKQHPTDGILLVPWTGVESAFGLDRPGEPTEEPETFALNVVKLRAYGKKAQARRS